MHRLRDIEHRAKAFPRMLSGVVVLCLFLLPELHAQRMSGRDFWFMCPPHGIHQVYITAEEAAIVTLESPRRNWTQVFPLNPTEGTVWLLPGAPAGNNYGVNTPRDAAFRIRSTGNVVVYIMQYRAATLDLASVYPVTALGTRYIVQDYPSQGNNKDAQVGFAAAQDNTVITFTVPNASDAGIAAGTTVTVTLMEGQDYWLGSTSFTGMEVTSNYPFALFQGGEGYIERRYLDYIYEQALPVKCWGTDFLVVGTTGTMYPDKVRITSSADSCMLELDGTIVDTLQRCETYEFEPDSASVHHVRTCKPATVVVYTSGCGGELGDASTPGDPSSVVIPTIDQGINSAVFRAIFESTIQHVYVNIVTTASAVDGMTLDGVNISSQFQPYDTHYKYASIPLEEGTHTLVDTLGTFVAFVYGIGMAEAYSYVVGTNINDISYGILPASTDTARLCQGETKPYCITNTPTANFTTEWYIDGRLADTGSRCLTFADTTPGVHTVELHVITGSLCDLSFTRHVEVLPAYRDTIYVTVHETDSFVYEGQWLHADGEYPFLHRTSRGCDSNTVVELTVLHGLQVTQDQDICIGDSVRLYVQGISRFQWRSYPTDSTLEGRERNASFYVAPRVTTRYVLCDLLERPLDTVLVQVFEPPHPCVTTSSPVVDFDAPEIALADCSPGAVLHWWTFPDGSVQIEKHVKYTFDFLDGDSVGVALTTCSLADCCADTSFVFPVKTQSIWFPNIFTPGEQSNNLFGGVVTFTVEEYELMIFNRFGMCVFSTTDPDEWWDGTFDGRVLPQGSYAYQWRMKPTTDNLIRQGSGIVTLLR